jgi:hypothetical protein
MKTDWTLWLVGSTVLFLLWQRGSLDRWPLYLPPPGVS